AIHLYQWSEDRQIGVVPVHVVLLRQPQQAAAVLGNLRARTIVPGSENCITSCRIPSALQPTQDAIWIKHGPHREGIESLIGRTRRLSQQPQGQPSSLIVHVDDGSSRHALTLVIRSPQRVAES